jgi:hypothetical protein
MQKGNRSIQVFGALLLLAFLAAFAAGASPEKTPANVAGTWAVKVSGDPGDFDQTIVLTQDDAKIGGTFKGPRQSGTIDGSVDGNAIKFKVNGRVAIVYTGTVSGDSMSGEVTAQGKKGTWSARRTRPA